MTDFRGKVLMLGCGSVAQCTLPILFKLTSITPSRVTVIDFTDQRHKIQTALDQGLTYIIERITPENYIQILKKHLQSGDFLIDLAYNIDTAQLLDWCHQNGVFYLNTSVEMWNPYENAHSKDPRELTLYYRQMKLREMMSNWKNPHGPTAIVDHGANPGLVSHFIKQGLVDIGTKIIQESIPSQRLQNLEKALANEDFPRLSQLIGVKTIHISERDTQITNKPKKVNEFVNTWSVEGLIEEGVAPAELGWGTHEFNIPKGAMFHSSGPGNQICLPQKGAKTWVRSWVPSGEITGMVIRHGEAFSLSEYLSVLDENEAIYRPTVHYAYCPSDSAINSIHELEMRHFQPQPSYRILSDEITEGHDELGCLLMGHDYQSWWIGSVLDIHSARKLVPGQNATTVQVAIGVVSAAMYIMRHPNKGFCLPDHINYKEILEIARPYLGDFISVPVKWNPLDNIEAYTDYNEKPPTSNEMWQFTTFLVSSHGYEESPEPTPFAELNE